MLLKLEIQNLAVIDRLSVSFSSNFNVITGETGAGKSVLIKALGLLLGHKADTDVIRKGCELAVVCGFFQLCADHPVFVSLASLGIPLREKGNNSEFLLVKRQLSRKGRSQAWINDIPVTVTTLKSSLPLLVNILSQHENQRLLNAQLHLQYLDAFIEKKNVKRDFDTAFAAYSASLVILKHSITDYLKNLPDLEYLKFRMEEFRLFDPSCEDFGLLLEKRKQAVRVKKIKDLLCRAIQCFEVGGLSELAQQVAKSLGESPFKEIHQQASSASETLMDISYQLTKELAKQESFGSELNSIQNRIADYHDLFRKFSVSGVQELLTVGREQTEKIMNIENFAEILGKKMQTSFADLQTLQSTAARLTSERRQAVKKIKLMLRNELDDLDMDAAEIDFHFEKISPQVNLFCWDELSTELKELGIKICQQFSLLDVRGAEKGYFVLRANQGDRFYPLNKIASGGETSRIILGLQKLLANFGQISLLVFDEVDTGISGATAAMVGKKMREVSRCHQVIAVSHLPQVVAYADRHFRADKNRKAGKSIFNLVQMDKQASAKEIARLLSGNRITETGLSLAKVLKENARTEA